MSNADDLLFAGGLPSLSFKDKAVGFEYNFTIDKVNEPRQQNDLVTNKPKSWDDGRPMMTVPVDIILDPGTFTPEDPSDRGLRSWWINVGSQTNSVVRDAVRAVNGQGLEKGAHIRLMLAGSEPSSIKGANDKKLYAVTYTRPSAAAANSTIMGAPTSAPETVSVQQGLPQQVPPTPPGVDPVALAAAMSALTPEQRSALGLPNF